MAEVPDWTVVLAVTIAASVLAATRPDDRPAWRVVIVLAIVALVALKLKADP